MTIGYQHLGAAAYHTFAVFSRTPKSTGVEGKRNESERQEVLYFMPYVMVCFTKLNIMSFENVGKSIHKCVII